MPHIIGKEWWVWTIIQSWISLSAFLIKTGKIKSEISRDTNSTMCWHEAWVNATWAWGGGGSLTLLYCSTCVEHLNSHYLRAEHLANCCSVSVGKDLQISDLSVLFPSHSKENCSHRRVYLCCHCKVWLVPPKPFQWTHGISGGNFSSVIFIAVCAFEQHTGALSIFP